MGRALRIGLYSPYFGATYGGGEKYLLMTARAIREAWPEHRVEVSGAVPADIERYEEMFALDLSGIEFSARNRRVTPVHRALNAATPLRPLRNAILSRQAARATAAYDLFLGMIYRIPVESQARRGVLLCQFPYPGRQGLKGYQSVVCQSEYVAGWVRRWWEQDPAIVNPPVDVPEAEPDWSCKRRSILTVGRFVATGHAKRHDLMVAAFRELCDAGLSGWTLHLAGSVHRSGPHAGYLERVAEAARGYPIELHPDAPRPELENLYQEASIYWHAAGFKVDAEADPEALEHFGITTAEAMAHGAVPVAIGVGGQPEVVRDGEDGFLWRTIEELRAKTLHLAADAGLRRRLGEAARAKSRRWSRDEFTRRMRAQVAPIVEELERQS